MVYKFDSLMLLFFLLVENRLMYLVPLPVLLKLPGSKVGRFAGIYSMESQLTLVTVALLLVLLPKDDVAPGIYSLFFLSFRLSVCQK